MSPRRRKPAPPTERGDSAKPAAKTQVADRGAPPTIAAGKPPTGGDPPPRGEPSSREPWDDFDIIEEVGRGGMGFVYKAHQKSLDRIVALKVLAPDLASDKEAIERFFQGARASARLNHQNVVTGYAVGEDHGRHFFAMEFVDGETLEDILERERSLRPSDVVRVARALARALDHAEARHLVHRDVKPANIMVTTDGIVKLTDLGIAKTLDRPGMTVDNSVFGTPWYISPEQSRNAKSVDIRADIYSLGATLYHLISGHPPFEADNMVDVLLAMERGDLQPLPASANCPPQLVSIIERMMERDPEQRFQSPRDLLEALNAIDLPATRFSWMDEAAPSRAARSERPRKTSPSRTPDWRLIAVGVVLATLAAYAAVRFLGKEPAEPIPAAITPTAVPAATATPPTKPKSEASYLEEVIAALAAPTPRLRDAKFLLADLQAYYPKSETFRRMNDELERGTLVLFEAKAGGSLTSVPAWGKLDQSMTAGDEYRFAIIPTRACYTYIFQIDGAAMSYTIFPSGQYMPGVQNPLPAGRLHWLPPNSRLPLDDATGLERIYLVSLTHPLDSPPSLLSEIAKDPEAARQKLRDRGPNGDSNESCFADEWLHEFRFAHR